MLALASTRFARAALATRRFSTTVLSNAQLLSNDADKTFIGGYSNTGFMVNNCEVQGSIFATPKLFLMWEPNAVEEILPSHLELLTLLHPKPDVVLLGTGSASKPLPISLHRFFQQHGISVEVSSTVNTISTFNILCEEGRNVACAVLHLGGQEDSSRSRVL